MIKFMKKWWLEHRFYVDGRPVEFSGWINTIHICKNKEDLPKTISGTFTAELSPEGFHGNFQLDDPSVCEPDDGRYVIMAFVRYTDIPLYDSQFVKNRVEGFPQFTAKIEDCLKLNSTYAEILEDGFTRLKFDATYSKSAELIQQIYQRLKDLKSTIGMFSSYGGEKVPYSREIVSKEFLRYYMLFMLASFGNISDDGIARLTKKSFEKVLKTYLSTNSPYKKNIHKMGKKLLITDVELKDFLDNGKLCNAMSDSLVEYATTYFSENYTMPPLSVLPYNAHI